MGAMEMLGVVTCLAVLAAVVGLFIFVAIKIIKG